MAVRLISGFAVAASAAAGETSFEVREPSGVGRVDWPVMGGVPFARGALADPANVELVDGQGRSAPLQREALARWPDGTVKWLLLDFFCTVEANAVRKYTLRHGPAAPPAPPAPEHKLTRRRTENGVFIDTGVLRAEVSRRFLESLSLRGGNGEWTEVVNRPGEMWMTVNGENEGRYLASLDPEAEVAVEQSGPIRVCVRISGWHRSPDGSRFGRYVLRVHAYAGQPYLRVFHTFINSDLPERGLITGVGLRAPLALGEWRTVCYGGLARKAQAGWPGWLAQTDWNRQEIIHEGQPLEPEASVRGYMAAGADAGAAACFVRDWPQLFPKKLELNKRGLTAWLWPASCGALDLRREEQRLSEEWLAFRRDYPEAYAEWIDPGTQKSAGIGGRRYQVALRRKDMDLIARSGALGLARTHEMLLSFSPKLPGVDELNRMSDSLQDPLLPFVAPRQVDATEVLGRFGWEDAESFPEVENHLRRKLDWIIRHQNEWSRWWGLIDWGGIQCIYEKLRSVNIPGQWLKFLGRHGWKNSEVDIPFSVMFVYLRNGDPRAWRFFESMLRHQMDVDTMHLNLPDFEAPGHKWALSEWTRGGQHRHSYNHWSGAPNMGHTWNESLVNYYFLTGDRRAYDVALEVGQYSIGVPGGGPGHYERVTKHPREESRFGRDASNAYRNLLKCYEMTGDDKWLQEALKWRQHFLDHSPEYLDKQHSTFLVTHYLVQTFVLDYCMFKDKAVGEELVKTARWHCNHIKRGYDERGLHYPYLACGVAWWLTRDDELLALPWHRYLSQCRSSTDKAEGPGDYWQTHFYEFNQLPFYLRACREAGFSEANPPQRPAGLAERE